MTTLGEKAARFFDARAIDLDRVAAMGICSDRLVPIGASEPAETIVFPYMERGEQVNAKFRGPNKRFWQQKGGKKTFYNSDVLDLKELQNDPDGGKAPAVVIVEGEMDCLAVLSAGYPFCVSVPDGAPADKDANGKAFPSVPEHADDIDPEQDTKFSYVFDNFERLKKIKRFILMTDPDGPGERLRDELARRLGRDRCSFVHYPACGNEKSDANEVLKQHGPAAVLDMIKRAQPFPMKGIYHLADFPESDRPEVFSTGFALLDPSAQKQAGVGALQVATGFFMVVLGAPGSGKSTWTLQLAFNMARIQGWNVGLGSFEVLPVPYVRDIMRNNFMQAGPANWTATGIRAADSFINKKFTFFHVDTRTDDSEMSLEWLLDLMAKAVVRDGIKMVVIDPWNELEHARRRDETETQYAGRAIRALKKFAMSYDVLVVVVVHPTKSGGTKDQGELSLYDADGSAHWVNKPDIGLVIERREDGAASQCIVHGRKFRFSFLGRKGETSFSYDPETEILDRRQIGARGNA